MKSLIIVKKKIEVSYCGNVIRVRALIISVRVLLGNNQKRSKSDRERESFLVGSVLLGFEDGDS